MRAIVHNGKAVTTPETDGFECSECGKTWELWDSVMLDPCRCWVARVEESMKDIREGRGRPLKEVLAEL